MRNKLLYFGVALLVLLLSACASTPSGKQSRVWPGERPFVSLYNRPQPMGSVEEAIGTIKNLQRDLVEWGAGIHFSNIDIDAYGLRARWEWTETTQSTEYVPSYSGMFVGWNYVPIYGGSYQTQTMAEQKSDLLTLPFDEVVNIALFHMPDLERKYKWGMEVWLQGNKRVAFRTSSQQGLMKLNRAVVTLAMNRGAPFRPSTLGLEAAPLTSAQSHKLGIPLGSGMLIYSVSKGGPADLAGVRFLDVILELDNIPVKAPQELMELIKKAYDSQQKTVVAKVLSGKDEAGSAARDVVISLPY